MPVSAGMFDVGRVARPRLARVGEVELVQLVGESVENQLALMTLIRAGLPSMPLADGP